MNGGSLNRQGLTLKQARFVHYYIKTGGNGVVAAQNAGYQSNYQTLAAIASENLNKPKVRSELRRRMSKVLTSNEVLEKLSDVAETSTEKVTTADKLKALELLGKVHKLFVDRSETVDSTEAEARKTFLLDELRRLRTRFSDDDDYANEVRRFQALMSDQGDPTYKADFDPANPQSLWRDVPAELLPDAEAPTASEANN